VTASCQLFTEFVDFTFDLLEDIPTILEVCKEILELRILVG